MSKPFGDEAQYGFLVVGGTTDDPIYVDPGREDVAKTIAAGLRGAVVAVPIVADYRNEPPVVERDDEPMTAESWARAALVLQDDIRPEDERWAGNNRLVRERAQQDRDLVRDFAKWAGHSEEFLDDLVNGYFAGRKKP